MDISIRLLKTGDYESVREVDILTQKQYLGRKFNELSLDEQDTHLVSRRSEFSINVDTGYCFVAEVNNQIVGFLLAHETLPFAGTLCIRYIGINPEYQSKGVGSILYKKLIEKAMEKKIYRIQALINLDNPKSIKLHEKLGFKIGDRKEAVLAL